MARGFIVLLVFSMLITLAGCTMSDVMGVQEEKPVPAYEPKPDLSAKENYSLQIWMRAATMADQVGDCATAILYYTKIVDYFPDTEEGVKAQDRLDELSGKPKAAEQESSL